MIISANELNPDNPKDFLKFLHPIGEPGDIILERSLKQNSKSKARISPIQLITTANEIWGQPDYFVSACRFNKFPYICHFKQANALWIALPIDKEANTEFIDATLRDIGWRLSSLGIPLWSFVIYDGGQLLFFWIVKTPIAQFQYYKWYQCQKTLHFILRSEFKLSDRSLDATETIRVVGSLNTNPRKYVRLEQNRGRTYEWPFLKATILNQAPLKSSESSELEEWNSRFFQLLDLLRIRLWKQNSNSDLYNYWFLFMGLAISRFCPAKALERELTVVARLIEGKKWSEIESQYTPFIQKITQRNIFPSECVEWLGETFHIQRTPWDDLIRQKLEITHEELNSIKSQTPALGIQLYDSMSELSFHRTFIDDDEGFVPLKRLLIRSLPSPLHSANT